MVLPLCFVHHIFLVSRRRKIGTGGRKTREGRKEVKRIKKSGGIDMESWREGKENLEWGYRKR